MHFVIQCRKCLKKTGTVVSYLMKFRSERMSGLIRNLTALRSLRILEVRAGLATVQIMPYFSWSVVCIRSGSSQWLTTSVVEVLRLRCLEVLGACQNVGLHVVATICDMGTKNIKAMKLLGSTGEKPFFQFQNQAIATIYALHTSYKLHP